MNYRGDCLTDTQFHGSLYKSVDFDISLFFSVIFVLMACLRMPVVSLVVALAFLCPLRGKWLDRVPSDFVPSGGRGVLAVACDMDFHLPAHFNSYKMFMLRQIMSYYDSGILILLSMKFNYFEFIPNTCKPATF